MRIALPCADATAWSIDEHPVEFRFGRQLRSAIPRDGTIIKHFGPGGSSLKALQAPAGAIACPNQSFVAHEIGKVQSLAALAGAGIPPGLVGLGRADVPHDL